jgi:hypothetical protein
LSRVKWVVAVDNGASALCTRCGANTVWKEIDKEGMMAKEGEGYVEDIRQMLKPPSADELHRFRLQTLHRDIFYSSAAPAQDVSLLASNIYDLMEQHEIATSSPLGGLSSVPCSCGRRLEVSQNISAIKAHRRHLARKIAEWLAEGK